MKTIIVATDFSKDANNAVEYAAALARCIHARLVLFNSFMIPAHAANTLMPASGIEQLIESNKASLEYAGLRLTCTYDIEVKCESNISDIGNAVDKLVEKYKASVVVMGMRGSSIEQKIFGNTTTSIIKRANYPVLAVPSDVTFKGIGKILFACSPDCAFIDITLERLKDLASDLKAEVEVFHVHPKKKAVLAAAGEEPCTCTPAGVTKALENVSHTVREVDGVEIIKAIRKEAADYKADLLVMVPQKYKFWDSILHTSKTGMMASMSPIPLLSIPNKD